MIQQSYLWPELFPLKRVNAYKISWDMKRHQSHLAGIYAHDGTPYPGQDSDYLSRAQDIMHVMAARTLHPNTIMQLRDIGELGVADNSSLAQRTKSTVMEKVMEKTATCQDEVEAVLEYLAMQAITGTIVWPPTGISPAPSYWGNVSLPAGGLSMGFRSNFVQAASTLVGANSRAGTQVPWGTVATANPVKDLEVIAELIEETTGLNAWNSTLIMSRGILSLMAEHSSTLQWIRGTNGPAPDSQQGLLDMSALKTSIQTRLGYNIRLYDAQWTYGSSQNSQTGKTETRVRFMDRKYILIIPNGAISGGLTYMACAPDLGAPNGENLGLYTWTWKDDRPPWTHEMGCGIHAWPVIKDSESIFLFDCLN